MIVTKILNNNAVCSLINEQEVILIGNGIGWNSKVGQEVDEAKIEKTFRMDTSSLSNQFKQLIVEVPMDAIQASNLIIEYASKKLNKQLNKNIYITLTDHINFARERIMDNIQYQNMLIYEAQRLYPEEYKIGLKALEIIKKEMGIEFPKTEAGSIAIHIVNAEYEADMESTVQMSKLIQSVLDIVRYSLRMNFDIDSLNYQRFNTHLLFFSQRVLKGKMLIGEKDEVYNAMKTKNPKEFQTALKIQTYLNKNHGVLISDEEVTYLCVHIARLKQRG